MALQEKRVSNFKAFGHLILNCLWQFRTSTDDRSWLQLDRFGFRSNSSRKSKPADNPGQNVLCRYEKTTSKDAMQGRCSSRTLKIPSVAPIFGCPTSDVLGYSLSLSLCETRLLKAVLCKCRNSSPRTGLYHNSVLESKQIWDTTFYAC